LQKVENTERLSLPQPPVEPYKKTEIESVRTMSSLKESRAQKEKETAKWADTQKYLTSENVATLEMVATTREAGSSDQKYIKKPTELGHPKGVNGYRKTGPGRFSLITE
jgi:hypothetical protein